MAHKRRLKDVKAEKAEKKRRARRRKRAVALILEILILFTLLAVGYVLQKYGKINTNKLDEENIIINSGVTQEGYTTVALFGGDSREGVLGAGTHADTMMVVSIDQKTKDVRLISVYRDTPLRQKNGEILKANSAYFMGGPEEAISMLNQNLDLDIQDYVTVDFKALADVIDLLGGIEIDVSEAEAAELNKYIDETATVTGKKAIYVSGGSQTLDGVQAVTYARIRKNVGGDYARTGRQQLVIQKVVEKVKKTDLLTINEIINQVFSQVSTSFELTELIKLAAGVAQYDIKNTGGFPFEKIDGSISGVGSVVVPLGFVENVQELHEFLYPEEEYAVSETIGDIAADIEYLTGYTRDDYAAPENNNSDEE